MIKVNFVVIALLSLLLCSCAKGTYLSPIIAPSTLDVTKTNATVFFYRSNDLCGSIDVSGDKIVVVDFKTREDLPEDYEGYRGKEYFEKDEVLLANRKVFSSLELPSGIHTFSFLGTDKQTVKLDAGNTYYLAVGFKCIPGRFISQMTSFEFRTKDEFVKDTEGKSLIRMTTVWKPFEIFKKYKYEVVDKID